MAERYEYYITGDDTASGLYGPTWIGQTFTPSIAHKITSVKLLLYRMGFPGTVTVSIKATDGEGKPTGDDLCSGTTDGNTLPTESPYEWREITLGDGYDLDADTKYAIVVKALDGEASNQAAWRRDATDATYAGGQACYSINSGVTWSIRANEDQMFEEWGEVPVVGRSFGYIMG